MLALLTTTLLSACSPSAPGGDPLDGSSWQLAELGGTPAVAGADVTLEFADGQAGGTAGCNSYGGAYQVEGKNITFKDVASTLMLCTGTAGVMEQEAAFLGSLNEVERFELGEGQLRLIRSDGGALTFVPAP
jgi:heat shock protein HslJ